MTADLSYRAALQFVNALDAARADMMHQLAHADPAGAVAVGMAGVVAYLQRRGYAVIPEAGDVPFAGDPDRPGDPTGLGVAVPEGMADEAGEA